MIMGIPVGNWCGFEGHTLNFLESPVIGQLAATPKSEQSGQLSGSDEQS